MESSGERAAARREVSARRGGRGAPLKPLSDTSPLDGPQHNAGVRIGMLLRLHRMCDEHGRYARQSDLLEALLAAGHHATTTALSRVESGTFRSGALLRGYEDVLGLEDGSLRAVAALLSRSQPSAPPDRDPVVEEFDVHRLSALAERVLAPDAPGSAWYAFGRGFARADSKGLPVPTMRAALDRLLECLRTSGGLTWVMQVETLLLLREGPYADLVPPCTPRDRAVNGVAARSRPTGPRSKDRRNPDWTWSHDAAHRLTVSAGLPEQPVLARVLYDVVAGASDTRATDAGITIAALPFADAAIRVLRHAAQHHPDRFTRERLARRLTAGWARR